ncbi:hypothetical protein [Streptomyces ficellus]|uniref:Uncharacterized protein n=1 Tax=Streptomyces ficellus TaxID=1977088 RepID=A0A6I6F0N5_9ACTN|nr:hypothetical protein [Streptomyces ficellus]QGV77270.1 hypothetical protein EIZ62_02620 [Streptomyces ficellus]
MRQADRADQAYEGEKAYEVEELTQTERMTLRWHLHCVASLLPYEQRAAVLEAWLTVDPSVLFIARDPSPELTVAVIERGSVPLRVALAGCVGDRALQDRLIDADEPEVDRRLAGNPRLQYEPGCRLRLRDPAVMATARHGYRADHHRRALLSGDPDLAAAALVDRRGDARGDVGPTTWAAAWVTVRRHGGTARIRRVLEDLSALPGPLDPVGADVAAACAEAWPEPFLDTVEERWLGTGALLRRLRSVREPSLWEARRTVGGILREPYRIDWRLVAAARFGGRRRLPRAAVTELLLHPDCPPDVAVVLRTGRPALPGRPLPPPAPRPAAPADPAAQAGNRHRPPWVPAWQPPGDTGPLGDSAESARAVLREAPVAYRSADGPTLDHLHAVIERGLLHADEVAALVRPAEVLTSWVGQGSGHADVRRAAWSGRSALHVATSALLARWTAGEVRPGPWIAMYSRIRRFPGSLPELLAHVERFGRAGGVD